MTNKAKAESIRQKLLVVSKKMEARYQDIETIFLIERLVARLLSHNDLAKSLVFKGGFVGLKVYESPRYTVDLDALLIQFNLNKTLELVKQQAQLDLDDGVWFHFEDQIDLATQGEYGGIRQVYRAGIGEVLKNIKKAQIIHFDLGIGDPITPAPRAVETQSIINQESLSWSVYPIESICAEKLHALVVHGDFNSRSKDVHDLAIFLPQANIDILKNAIVNCFSFRGTIIPNNLYDEIKNLDTTRLRKGWSSAVASISKYKIFDEAFENIMDYLKNIKG